MDLLMRPQPGDKESDRLVWLDQDYARVHSFNMTVAHFLHDLYLGILPGAWAQETRALLWEPREPLFKPWEGPKL
jgi:hypothetical protein